MSPKWLLIPFLICTNMYLSRCMTPPWATFTVFKESKSCLNRDMISQKVLMLLWKNVKAHITYRIYSVLNKEKLE